MIFKAVMKTCPEKLYSHMRTILTIALSLFSLSIFAQTGRMEGKTSTTEPMSSPIGGEFAHVVLFWLRNPDSQEDREKFEASIEKFIKSSGFVRSMHLGKPADTRRPVIDASYSYCLIVTFDSKEEQDEYQAEPVHQLFIEESKDLWEKVTVYDSVNLW